MWFENGGMCSEGSELSSVMEGKGMKIGWEQKVELYLWKEEEMSMVKTDAFGLKIDI